MLIIVEGADGAGKSTLIAQLLDRIATLDPTAKIHTRHCVAPTEHPLTEYEAPLYDYRPGRDEHIIYDRHFVGEWVYPKIFNRPTFADVASWRHITAFLASRGALLIHVAPPATELRRRIEQRGDDNITPKLTLDASQLFYDVLTLTRPLTMMFHNGSTSPSVRDLVNEARGLETEAVHLNDFTTYVGPTKPAFLLLGDMRHHLRHDVTSPVARADLSPAFVPFPGTSGHYLLSHLPRSIFTVCGFANACDVDDITRLVRRLDEPRVVTLGQHATATASVLGNSRWCRSAPHPQFIRRFYHRHGLQYGRFISEQFAPDAVFDGFRWRPEIPEVVK